MAVRMAPSSGTRASIAGIAAFPWGRHVLLRHSDVVLDQEDTPADVSANELTAEVTGVRWSVPDGDFAVLDARTDDDGDDIVIVGPLAHVHEGESIAVDGGWRRHPQHGWQFQATRVRVQEPVGDHAVRAYLESIKHVGPLAAVRLVKRFGAGEVL